MTIYFVDLPIKNGDFPVRYVNVYQKVSPILMLQRTHPKAPRKIVPLIRTGFSVVQTDDFLNFINPRRSGNPAWDSRGCAGHPALYSFCRFFGPAVSRANVTLWLHVMNPCEKKPCHGFHPCLGMVGIPPMLKLGDSM